MNIMTTAHSRELSNFSIAITSKREHILKIPMLTIWIFRLRCAVPPNKLFLGKKDLIAANLTYSKIKAFFRCAYFNTFDVFKFYESRQCCTTISLTTFHNLIISYLICFFFPFCNSSHLQNCMQFSMCNTCTILYYPF